LVRSTNSTVPASRAGKGALSVPPSQGLPVHPGRCFLDAMRAAIFNEPGSVTVGERRDPVVADPTDAVVRVALACVCGSDLWYYRGDSPFEPRPIGHEFVGVVEDVGADVRETTKGDFVIAPF